MVNSCDPGTTGAPWARWRIEEISLIFAPAFILFCIGAVTDFSVPGIYMDAINPDYLVVRLLNPAAANIPAWTLPGTILFGLFPLVGQIYHGALPYYVGLPFYALFGTGVLGIRLTNMVFGLIVLSGTGAFMWSFGVRPLICSLCLALLALDPGFLFSFRTQLYITLLPVAALLSSAALIESHDHAPSCKVIVASGLLAGIACYGYFIYVFLILTIALLAVYRWRHRLAIKFLVSWWVLGFLLGVLPNALSLCLLFVATGGLHGFIDFFRVSLHGLAPQSSTLSVTQRLHYFTELLQGTVLDVGPCLMMLQKTVTLETPVLKQMLLLAVPGIAIVTGIVRPARIVGLLVLSGFFVGFISLVLAFGNRLWLHHAALLLPVLYAALALALERLVSLLASTKPARAGYISALVVAPFLIANASDRQAVFLQLETTHGVGLSSDAIDRFAEDTLREAPGAHIFFPDWGIFMQFAMLTRGTVTYSTGFTPSEARSALCSGQDVEVVAVAAAESRPEQQVRTWISTVAWGRSETTHYDQPDGTPVLYIVHWRAADRSQTICP
jgi:hypothetical protein